MWELGSKREGACLQRGTGRNLVVIRVSTLTVCVFRDIQGMGAGEDVGPTIYDASSEHRKAGHVTRGR